MKKLGETKASGSPIVRIPLRDVLAANEKREQLVARRAAHRGQTVGPVVTLSNAIVRAGQGLTLAEKRVLMIAISKLDSRRAYKAGDVVVTKVTAAEYAEIADCQPHTAYEALKEARKQIYERSITWAVMDRNGNHKGSESCRWVYAAGYRNQEGYITLAWSPNILPHLQGLKKQFTTYQLRQASALRSIYSWRLLEMLTQFEATGVLEVTIDDFCHAVEAPEKVRKNFAFIRRRIIEPAVKELTEKDGWKISWRPVKAGRKVASLHFDFERDPQWRLF